MSLSKIFKTDTDKESQGVAISYSTDEHGNTPTFWIRRSSSSNTAYQKALERLTKPHASELRTGVMSRKAQDELMREAFIQGCLVRWDAIPFSDLEGDETLTGYAPFTHDNARKLFKNLPELYVDLQEKAAGLALFRADELEADLGN